MRFNKGLLERIKFTYKFSQHIVNSQLANKQNSLYKTQKEACASLILSQKYFKFSGSKYHLTPTLDQYKKKYYSDFHIKRVRGS